MFSLCSAKRRASDKDLPVQLGDLKVAYDLASEAASEDKWKQLAELATTRSKFSLAQECLHKAQDFGKF